MNHSMRWVLFLLVGLGVAPRVAYAQASIAGVVKDVSGGVLPGVTVEAASPALIEKTRSVATDGTGQYKIVDLRPGTYTVTFTLTGFNTVKREGVELTGSFNASINIDMRVGALEETVTVTGETPIVDIQSVNKQRVLGHEVIDAVPTGRSQYNFGVLIPGVSVGSSLGGTQDVGGALGDVQQQLVAHGGRATDQRMTIGGMTAYSAEGSGQFTIWMPNMSATQEMTFDFSGGAAENPTGGVRMNIIPREGGNSFKGSVFATGVNHSFQGSNLTDDLKKRQFLTPDRIKEDYDFAPGAGGPILKDKLWAFASTRFTGNHNYVGGVFENANLNNKAMWTYVADSSKPGIYELNTWDANARLTWQATSKNKFSVFYDTSAYCRCNGVILGSSPENIGQREYPMQRVATVTWSSPVTSRLLLEAGWSNRSEKWRDTDPPYLDSTLQDSIGTLTPGISQVHLIGVTEQSNNFSYRSVTKATHTGFTTSLNYQYKAALTYVTGSHAFKFGFTDNPGSRIFWQSADNLNNIINYRLNNGVPNQLTMYAKPTLNESKIRHDLGVYAQDRWTVRRLTANLGVRFEYFSDYFPASHAGPGPFVPNRDINFPETDWVSWKDITPRLGAAYDLFGDGKTAVKVSLNKYMVATGLQGNFGAGSNPVGLLSFTATRAWDDTHGKGINNDFVPQCNLINPLANGECDKMSDLNFGSNTQVTAVDLATVRGWGVRNYNWEFSAGVQREVIPRVSVDLGYFRRWYGNFTVTDNLAVLPTDFTAFSVPVPSDPGLPNGGGNVISGFYNLNQNKVGQVNNLQTDAANYGNQIEHWNGMDFTVNARLQRGLLVQGGLSTGRTLTDLCDVVAKLPELSVPNAAGVGVGGPYCRQETNWLTQVKFLGAYTIPKINLQASATFQSSPGPLVQANYNAPNSVVQPTLGRLLSGGATNVTVNLVAPGTMYGDRLNQLDLRVAKLLKFGEYRLNVNLDLYNALNSNAILVQNNAFASWQQPQQIVQARFAKISAQFDF